MTLVLLLVGAAVEGYGTAGVVYGGDLDPNVVYGGDTSGEQGIVVGGDSATGVVFGGDGRAG